MIFLRIVSTSLCLWVATVLPSLATEKSSEKFSIAMDSLKIKDHMSFIKQLINMSLDDVKKLKSNHQHAYALLVIYEIKKRIGDATDIESIVEKIANLSKLVKDETKRGFLFKGLASEYMSLGNKAKAFEYANKIKSQSLRNATFAYMAEILISKSTNTNPESAITQAMDIAKKITSSFYQLRAMTKIATALSKAGEIDAAIKIAKDLKSRRQTARVLMHISIAYASVGHVSGALKIARGIKISSVRENTLSGIARVLVKKSKLPQALNIIQSIRNDNTRLTSLTRIAKVLIEQNKLKESRLVIEMALVIFKNESKPYLRVIKFLKIAKIQLFLGDRINSKIIIKRDIYQLLKRKRVADYQKGSFAQAMAIVGSLNDAINISQAIPDKFYRDHSIWNIAEFQVMNGDSQGAIKIIEKYIHDKSEHAQDIAILIGKIIKKYGTEKALIIASDFSDSYNRIFSYMSIASHHQSILQSK